MMKLTFKRSTWAGVILAGMLAAGAGTMALAQDPAAPATPATDPAAPADAAANANAAAANANAAAANANANTADAAAAEPKAEKKTPTQAELREGLVPDKVYDALFRILFTLLVVALVMESALAVIFNWSVFLRYFNAKALKSVIAVIVGVIIAYGLDIDAIGRIYGATNTEAGPNAPLGDAGYFLTALILGGGSAGIRNIMKGLGFRDVLTREDVTPKPTGTWAWLAVRVKRKTVPTGPVRVLVQQDKGPLVLMGVVGGKSSSSAFLRTFLTDPGRFPPVAGHAVAGGHDYTVVLQGPNDAANSTPVVWGPFRLEAGAVIDTELSI